jgi:predicted nucleotidyltransferase
LASHVARRRYCGACDGSIDAPVEGRAHEESDVDLVVLGTAPGAYWELRHALEDTLGRSLDLFTETDDARFVAKARARGP